MFVKLHILGVGDIEKNMEKTFYLAVGVSGCLKTSDSVVNMLVMVNVGWLYIPTECYLVMSRSIFTL